MSSSIRIIRDKRKVPDIAELIRNDEAIMSVMKKSGVRNIICLMTIVYLFMKL
jgi:hypothetical protein